MTLALQTIFAPLQNRPQLLKGLWLDRNWHLESTPIWSRDLTATLAVDMERFTSPRPVLLELRVFGASPPSPRSLTLSSQGHEDQTFLIHTSNPIQVLMWTPEPTDGTRYRQMGLSLDAIRSPIQCGFSADERLLGLQIVSVTDDISVLALPLDLTASPVAASPLGQGWAAIEADVGAWTVGAQADLTLPGYLRPSGTATLVLDLHVLARPEGTEPLVAEASYNGQPLARWEFGSETSAQVHCPLPFWRENIDFKMSLRLQGVMSPQELGINADVRPLGLQLRRMDLQGDG